MKIRYEPSKKNYSIVAALLKINCII